MGRWLRVLEPLIALAVFLAAAWLLRRELEHFSYHQIRQALLAIPRWRIGLAIALTALNYLVLVGYDWLSVWYLGYPLPPSKVAVASFIGHVSSFNLGAVVGGTPVRYRLYSAWGLSAVEIVKLIALSSSTFWIGFLAVAGAVFVLEPFTLPSELHIPFETPRPIGWTLLALTGCYLLLSARRVTLRWREWEFPVPPLGLALAQLAIAAADLLIAGAIVYVLVGPVAHVSFLHLLAVYLLAVVAVLFTHVPGGLGVLELVMLVTLSPEHKAGVLGAILAFRVVYYLLPLGLAAGLLAGHELAIRGMPISRLGTLAGRWAPAAAPNLLSLALFVTGATMVISGALPIPHGRLSWLGHVLPLGVIEISHLLGSICGVVLLILAHGIQRRLDSAYWLTIGVLIAAIFFSLAKGIDVEQTLLLLGVLAALLPCHPYFYRRSALLHERFSPGWIAAIAALLVAAVWLGLFAHKHLEYSHDLWWWFALRANAPRALRAAVGVAATVLVVAIAQLFRVVAPKPHRPDDDELAAARQIVSRAPQTCANLALLGDKWFLLNEARTALVMYRVEGRSWVALGDPLGPADQRAEMAWQFREFSEHYGGWTVFYQVAEDNLSLYVDMGLQLTKLGEEARVPLDTFSLEGRQRKDLRHTQSQLLRADCHLEIVPPEEVLPLLPELREISAAWLAEKHAKEKGFSLGYFDEDYLRQFPLAVVRQSGRIVAFANIWCGADKAELAVDLMRRRPDAPAGAMDFLLIELMLWGKAQGYAWFNLGMAPLAGMSGRTLAPRLHRLGSLVYRRAEHFYNFRGLRAYKDKFDPIWTPKYLASPGGLALPRILANLTALVGRAGRGKKGPTSDATEDIQEPTYD